MVLAFMALAPFCNSVAADQKKAGRPASAEMDRTALRLKQFDACPSANGCFSPISLWGENFNPRNINRIKQINYEKRPGQQTCCPENMLFSVPQALAFQYRTCAQHVVLTMTLTHYHRFAILEGDNHRFLSLIISAVKKLCGENRIRRD
jgi:hypothetical protein